MLSTVYSYMTNIGPALIAKALPMMLAYISHIVWNLNTKACPKAGAICVQFARSPRTCRQMNERTSAPNGEDSTSYREVSPDSPDSDKNIIRMQRAFRWLASRAQCRVLHPRKTHRPVVPSAREAKPRNAGRKEERESERADARASLSGFRYDRPTIVFP